MSRHSFFVPALCAGALAATASAQGHVCQPLLPCATAPQPQVRRSGAVAFDPVRDRVVMVAGRLNLSGSAVYPQETWEFDGVDWHLIGPVGPIAFGGYNDTTNVRAYYDTQRGATVAIESKVGGPTIFHEWTGAAWVPILSVPQTTFPWRYAFDVAYDPVRRKAVIFGGYTGNQEMGDTWEFNGTTLSSVSGIGPQARWGHAMAYDAGRGVVVLYGGRHGPQLADMWDWNGSSWQLTPNAAGPGPRAFHDLEYDVARSRLVLLGNDGVGSSQIWEWQTSGWTQAPVSNSANSNMALVYDSVRDRVLSVGGTGPSLTSGPTSTFAYGDIPDVAAIGSVGTGCAGPTGVPQIQANNLPVFGTTLSLQVSNLPTGPLNVVIGFIGFDDTMWDGVPLPAPLDPMFPGCTVYLAPAAAQWLGVGFTGSVTWQIPIPFLPPISGAPFFLQCGVAVQGYNPGGLVFTNALAGVTGV